jgi:hypothetical protein
MGDVSSPDIQGVSSQEVLVASQDIPTRPATFAETQKIMEEGTPLEKLKWAARVNYQALEMIAPEKWEGDPLVPPGINGVVIESSWGGFCGKNGIEKKKDPAHFNSVKTDIPSSEGKTKWAVMTSLEDFRFDVVNPGDVSEAYKNAKRVIKLQGGWCSSREVMQDLANSILEQDPDAFVMIMDHPGQKDSKFLYPKDISKDPAMASLEENLLAPDVSLRFYGLANDQIVADKKEVTEIVHSREAAAHLFSKGLENPNIKYAFLAPVLGHKGLKAEVSQKLLGLAMWTAGKLENVRVTKGMVDWFSKLITTVYTGGQHKELIEKYLTSLKATSSEVLAAYIYNLYKVDFPVLRNVQFDPSRHLIQVYNDDAFVEYSGMMEAINQNLNKQSVEGCVRSYAGDHHAFMNEGSMARNELMQFLK